MAVHRVELHPLLVEAVTPSSLPRASVRIHPRTTLAFPPSQLGPWARSDCPRASYSCKWHLLRPHPDVGRGAKGGSVTGDGAALQAIREGAAGGGPDPSTSLSSTSHVLVTRLTVTFTSPSPLHSRLTIAPVTLTLTLHTHAHAHAHANTPTHLLTNHSMWA